MLPRVSVITATYNWSEVLPYSIGSGADSHMARTMRQLAGIAVAQGLTWEQALASLTTVPAQIYGLTGRGTVEKGAIADLVLWSGDPFELSSYADTIVIGGAVQPTVSHQTRLLDRYRKLTR